MKWVREEIFPGDVMNLEIDYNMCIFIGQYYDDSGTYQVSHTSDLVELFDCDRRFRKIEKCQQYVETRIKEFSKRLNEIVDEVD